MRSSRINLVMTVIGFGLSILFIVFVCTRLILARILLIASRRSARASRSGLTDLERGCHGHEHLTPANFPTKKYGELCTSSDEEENARCIVCLSDYHEEDTLCILPACGHFFHTACIGIWLQQHITCPICRVSLGEIPKRKWFMQPMFSSAIRTQSVNAHYCLCMANGGSGHLQRLRESETVGPVRDGNGVADGGDSIRNHPELQK